MLGHKLLSDKLRLLSVFLIWFVGATLILAPYWQYEKLVRKPHPTEPIPVTVYETDTQARDDLKKANEQIASLKEELGDARKDARETREMAARVQPKSFKERLLECLDSVDPTIKERLKTQTVIFRGELDIRKIGELQKLEKEPNASDYFELRIVSGLTGMYSGNVELSGTKGVEIVVERKLIMQP